MAAPAAIAPFVKDLRALVALMTLFARNKAVTRYMPKTYTTPALTLSASANVVSSFDSNALQNSTYPFALQQIDTLDTTSESNWRLRLIDKSTDWALFGSTAGYLSTRSLRCATDGGTGKTGEPTGLGILSGIGHVVGQDGGFTAYALSIGTASVTELTLSGIWILEW